MDDFVDNSGYPDLPIESPEEPRKRPNSRDQTPIDINKFL